jgi:hypothetical protein
MRPGDARELSLKPSFCEVSWAHRYGSQCTAMDSDAVVERTGMPVGV